LPDATQTGANTFGCLLNGKVWLPKGNDGTANFSVYYDPSLMGGTLNVGTYRYYGSGNNDRDNMNLYSDSLTQEGTYALYQKSTRGAIYSNWKACSYANDATVPYKTGELVITKLDLTNGIIAGTFHFTLYKPGCDSIRITQGRFDKKL
jgi:hypothetical protein